LVENIGKVLARSFLLLVSLGGIPVIAQQPQQFDDLTTQVAKDAFAKTRTELGAYQFLAGLAREAFNNGDHVKAVQLAIVLEHFWDGSPTTRDIGKNSHGTYEAIDKSMDAFIDALAKPKTDGSASTNVEAAYQKYTSNLQLTPLSEFLSKVITEKGVDAAIQQFRALQSQNFPGLYVNEVDINDNLGYGLLRKGDKAGAIKIFQLNVEMYPKSANVYDSLGEAYAANGQKDLAIANYRKALSIDPNCESCRSSKTALAKPSQ
jgi:tetratricopeptide (TPR) repeat protein